MKRIAAIIVLVAFSFLFCSEVYAHPGGTDSKGGHHVRATGEYHYHHGYSAHDHYDMDGDGDLDCPYDFKDNTTSKSSNSQNKSSSTIKSTYGVVSTTPTTPAAIAKTETGDEITVPLNFFFGALVAVSVLAFILGWVKVSTTEESLKHFYTEKLEKNKSSLAELNRYKQESEKYKEMYYEQRKKYSELSMENAELKHRIYLLMKGKPMQRGDYPDLFDDAQHYRR